MARYMPDDKRKKGLATCNAGGKPVPPVMAWTAGGTAGTSYRDGSEKNMAEALTLNARMHIGQRMNRGLTPFIYFCEAYGNVPAISSAIKEETVRACQVRSNLATNISSRLDSHAFRDPPCCNNGQSHPDDIITI